MRVCAGPRGVVGGWSSVEPSTSPPDLVLYARPDDADDDEKPQTPGTHTHTHTPKIKPRIYKSEPINRGQLAELQADDDGQDAMALRSTRETWPLPNPAKR